MSVSPTTEKTFADDVLNSPTPVLVDFWAEWCGPCRAIAPILEDISDEYSEKIKVVKVNTDENIKITLRYEIRSIPTLILFIDGEPTWRMIGAKSKSALLKDLETWLS